MAYKHLQLRSEETNSLSNSFYGPFNFPWLLLHFRNATKETVLKLTERLLSPMAHVDCLSMWRNKKAESHHWLAEWWLNNVMEVLGCDCEACAAQSGTHYCVKHSKKINLNTEKSGKLKQQYNQSNFFCAPCMPESTIHSHAPDCQVPRVHSTAGNHVNASCAIRLQLKNTLSETDISYIHQTLQTNGSTCCDYQA